MKKKELKDWLKKNRATILAAGAVTVGVAGLVLVRRRANAISNFAKDAELLGLEIFRYGEDEVGFKFVPKNANGLPIAEELDISASWSTEGAMKIAEAIVSEVADITQNKAEITAKPIC